MSDYIVLTIVPTTLTFDALGVATLELQVKLSSLYLGSDLQGKPSGTGSAMFTVAADGLNCW